uniref:Uncharacterized protein n=1 Tax=Anguilla anguilla TaxID=7936 RepID=A0A0E9XXB2_ANGAN
MTMACPPNVNLLICSQTHHGVLKHPEGFSFPCVTERICGCLCAHLFVAVVTMY